MPLGIAFIIFQVKIVKLYRACSALCVGKGMDHSTTEGLTDEMAVNRTRKPEEQVNPV